jgi:hypothetical protein
MISQQVLCNVIVPTDVTIVRVYQLAFTTKSTQRTAQQ